MSLGERGERAAASHLRRLGYKIVAFRQQRHAIGEADIIAVDGRTVVFVEVKTRRSSHSGHPAEAVGVAKQERLARFALAYLKRHDLLEHAARFDVVAVCWPSEEKPRIEHFKNAFEPPGVGRMFG
jgi:putative endonuclease